MALSNWDILMLNEKRKALPGCWVSPSNIKVEIYKNWLYIHDEKAYMESKKAYTKPIIMKIESGEIDYKDIHIFTLRGPQNGVFVVCWYDIYSKDYKNHTVIGAIGCGVSGYLNSRYVGVTKSSLKWFMREINKKEIDYFSVWNSDTKKTKRYSTKIDKYDVPDIFKKMNLLKGVRYNQGDAFFAVHNVGSLQTSRPGKQKKTIFSQLLGEKKR